MLAPALKLITQANPGLLASGTYYVAESEQGSIVGCGGWTHARPGDGVVEPKLGHIRHFATHPDWIKRGIGSAIYSRCETEAEAAGVTRFQCYASLNAVSFYSVLGFESMRRIDLKMGSDTALPCQLMYREF